MISPNDILEELGYAGAGENWVTDETPDPATAHVYRKAREAGTLLGTYVFRTSPPGDVPLAPRPAVQVVRANTREEAREIHKKLWNLGAAPFLIVILPNELRIYRGFSYTRDAEDADVAVESALYLPEVREKLRDFYASEIDSGHIWSTRACDLPTQTRVDEHLLTNLERLASHLSTEHRLKSETGNALIGKYIYIRYLVDRGILDRDWLAKRRIDPDVVLSRTVTLEALRNLVGELERTFNGGVFPLDLHGPDAPTEQAVRDVAGVLSSGDDPLSGQLGLDFRFYDFSFIPVELLSSIYERFLHEQGQGKAAGAYYTPEILADYLLSEVNHHHPIRLGCKVLDPCCGSGVFLVHAYRRLIELARRAAPDGYLSPEELRQILLDSIYGVERNLGACYVTEFSLILTLLSYVDPPRLTENEGFKFPPLHNERIFEEDFFHTKSPLLAKLPTFDWVVGNPPWGEINPHEDERHLRRWLEDPLNCKRFPVARKRKSDAFSWRVVDFLDSEGIVGLVMPAATVSNVQLVEYRAKFFTAHTVVRVTNFSNLAYRLFGGRAKEAALTIVYRPAKPGEPKGPILHYAPFLINQIPDRSLGGDRKAAWSLTINSSEIRVLPSEVVETGDGFPWKCAFWATEDDERILLWLRHFFATSLGQIVTQRKWSLQYGLQLRTEDGYPVRDTVSRAGRAPEAVAPLSASVPNRVLDPSALELHFSVPETALWELAPSERFIRTRGGRAGELVAVAPHLVLTASRAIFSEVPFIIRLSAALIALSAPTNDTRYLRAVALLLSSSVVRYLLFFETPSWGTGRSTLNLGSLKRIKLPRLSEAQVRELSNLYERLCTMELATKAPSSQPVLQLSTDEVEGEEKDEEENETVDLEDTEDYRSLYPLQNTLDDAVEQVLGLPNDISLIAREFMDVRLQFNQGRTRVLGAMPPDELALQRYGDCLVRELDEFTREDDTHHRVQVHQGDQFIWCVIQAYAGREAFRPEIRSASEAVDSPEENFQEFLTQQVSQWVYIKRSLREFDGSRVLICKPNRLVDWTLTEAFRDATDVIAEVLSARDRL